MESAMLTVKRTTAVLGAEIAGIDLSQPVSDLLFANIVDLLHKHEVVFFRGQKITPEKHLELSRRFGSVADHPRKNCCKPGYPQIFVVSNILEDGKPIGARDAGSTWHSDFSFMKEPSRASLFYALEVPQQDGISVGDTMFASVTAAYDALSDEMKARLGKLKAVYSYMKGYSRVRKHDGALTPLTEEQKQNLQDVEHPVVRTHPYTGRKCLFVNETNTTRIRDLSDVESEALLEQLYRHISDPKFVYRHKWQVGDFLIWDNCATQHCAIVDYDLPLRRRMERTTICGTVPY